MSKKFLSLSFPERFFWGATISAHQVEGGLHNQWTAWELENARSLAEQSKYRAKYLPAWEAVKDEAMNPENYISGAAVDHYNLYQKDVAALKKLNMNAFRFSIEWSRIEPEEGAWSAEAIEHYRRYLATLKAADIEPFVTLWHWTLPVWFVAKGGFEKRRNVRYFVRFAKKLIQELGKDFRYILTVNEPEVYVLKSYVHGEWPPQRQNKLQALRVYLNLMTAHKQIYKLTHAMSRKFIVGIAKQCMYQYAGDTAVVTRAAARAATWITDDFLLKRLRRKLDFIGVNYYQSQRFYGYRVHNPGDRLNDLGWDMQPQDIQVVLERLWRTYRLPLVVTENGCADHQDGFRKWWLSSTITAMHKALQNGVRLEGYLHWSLLDNFEWSSGFWPRFGLLAVDRQTMKRTARPSAVWFAQFLRQLRGKA